MKSKIKYIIFLIFVSGAFLRLLAQNPETSIKITENNKVILDTIYFKSLTEKQIDSIVNFFIDLPSGESKIYKKIEISSASATNENIDCDSISIDATSKNNIQIIVKKTDGGTTFEPENNECSKKQKTKKIEKGKNGQKANTVEKQVLKEQ